jgi:O-antigen/teichoic acid export membrane protein
MESTLYKLSGAHDAAADTAAVADPESPTRSIAEPAQRRRKGRKAYGKLARQGVAWSFVREGVGAVITAPSHLILARLLSPFDFGVAAAGAFFMTLATRLTNFGFNQALVRIKDLRPEHCAAVFVISMMLGFTAFAILAGSAGMIAAFFREPEIARMLPVAALTFVIAPIGTVPAALMSRDMRFKRTALTDWLSTLGQAISTLAFAFAGYGYWSLVYGQLVEVVVGTTSKLLYGTWRPSVRFSMAALRELLSFATGIFAKRLLDYLAKNLDNLVVGRVMGIVSLGFYDKAFRAMDRVLVRINTGGPMVSFRVFALMQDEPERFRQAYLKVVMGASLFAYPVLFGLAALGPDLIPVLYGERWTPSVIPFQILCLAGTFKVFNEYSGSAVQALGQIWSQVWRQALYAALLAACVAAFTFWGLVGAALGVLIATVAMYLLMQGLLARMTAVTARSVIESQLPGLLCGSGVAVAVFATRWLFAAYHTAAPQWQCLLAEVCVGSVAYLVFIKFNRFPEVRRLVRNVADDLSAPVGRVARLLV